jgi:hypothetical protein
MAGMRAALIAGSAVARLDSRLQTAPPAVRAGWQHRFELEEASATARLEGDWADAEELLHFEAGIHPGPPSIALSATGRIATLLRFAARRHPRSFWTPGRLMRLAGMVPGGGRLMPAEVWASELVADPRQTAEALEGVLSPATLGRWKALPPLLAAADCARLWHQAGLPGELGRLLAQAWLWRSGETAGLVLPLAWGFVGHSGCWRPWAADWEPLFLEAAGRGALSGLALLARLERARQRLIADAGRQPRHSPLLDAIAECLLAEPAISTRRLTERSGGTRQGVLNRLERLRSAGLVEEISRRGSHWVWRLSLA